MPIYKGLLDPIINLDNLKITPQSRVQGFNWFYLDLSDGRNFCLQTQVESFRREKILIVPRQEDTAIWSKLITLENKLEALEGKSPIFLFM